MRRIRLGYLLIRWTSLSVNPSFLKCIPKVATGDEAPYVYGIPLVDAQTYLGSNAVWTDQSTAAYPR
jgi:hypothetical protein